jgi:hypothetical protein
MSIVVAIRRPGARPLSRSEIERALETSSDFERDDDGGWRLIDASAEHELYLNVEVDEAWTDGSREWLSDAALGKLRVLAAVLEARVLGEEGEDITLAKPSVAEAAPESVGKSVTVMAATLAIVVFPFLLVFAVLRLPLVLWRITRRK